jgi:hypothetical protein
MVSSQLHNTSTLISREEARRPLNRSRYGPQSRNGLFGKEETPWSAWNWAPDKPPIFCNWRILTMSYIFWQGFYISIVNNFHDDWLQLHQYSILNCFVLEASCFLNLVFRYWMLVTMASTLRCFAIMLTTLWAVPQENRSWISGNNKHLLYLYSI